jgi:hypothetical protein
MYMSISEVNDKQQQVRKTWKELQREMQEDPKAFAARTQTGQTTSAISAYRDIAGTQSQAIASTRQQLEERGGDTVYCEEICSTDAPACFKYVLAKRRGQRRPVPPAECRKV